AAARAVDDPRLLRAPGSALVAYRRDPRRVPAAHAQPLSARHALARGPDRDPGRRTGPGDRHRAAAAAAAGADPARQGIEQAGRSDGDATVRQSEAEPRRWH